jgi:hypothetical protein
MIAHAKRSFTEIQDSPTASSSVAPEAIIQYMQRTMIGLTNHLHASIKVLESTSELRKLSAYEAAAFMPMLDPDDACDVTAISPLDLEFDDITISPSGPADEGLKLPENKRSPRRKVSAPTLGQRPMGKVSPASTPICVAHMRVSPGKSPSMSLDVLNRRAGVIKFLPQATWQFTRQPRADHIPGLESIDSASVDCADDAVLSGPNEPVPPPESSPPTPQLVAKRLQKNSKSKWPSPHFMLAD